MVAFHVKLSINKMNRSFRKKDDVFLEQRCIDINNTIYIIYYTIDRVIKIASSPYYHLISK